MTTAAPTVRYRVKFDRIGRHHTVADLEVATVASDWDDFAEQVYRFARKFLGSREVGVGLHGDGTGMIFVGGFRNGGSFTFEPMTEDTP